MVLILLTFVDSQFNAIAGTGRGLHLHGDNVAVAGAAAGSGVRTGRDGWTESV
ncbi:hypothetical protein [Oryza sativa Japonica Group]|uniref:Uncharacterized protein n=1 Tax=Oryza sativa subsp. japonica TaxID=39947 RepID=Q5NAQ4_ORYSJ|nr:hypothetical protein [Oryza sativa Japonica Group]